MTATDVVGVPDACFDFVIPKTTLYMVLRGMKKKDADTQATTYVLVIWQKPNKSFKSDQEQIMINYDQIMENVQFTEEQLGCRFGSVAV